MEDQGVSLQPTLSGMKWDAYMPGATAFPGRQPRIPHGLLSGDSEPGCQQVLNFLHSPGKVPTLT